MLGTTAACLLLALFPQASTHDLDGGVALAWEALHDSPASPDDRLWATALANGTVYAAGSSLGDASVCRVEARDVATGVLLWVAESTPPPGVDELPRALAVSADGARVFAVGQLGAGPPFSYAFGKGLFAAAWDATGGAPLWEWRLDPGTRGGAAALAVAPDGAALFVAGAVGQAGASDYEIVKLDAATGAVLWTRSWDDPDGVGDFAYDVALDPTGTTLFVTGAGGAYGTVALDAADGALRWEAPAGSDGEALAPTRDGALVAVAGLGGTRAYDAATGAPAWSGAAFAGLALALAPDGSHGYVLGRPVPSLLTDVEVARFDPTTGAVAWDVLWTSPAGGSATADALVVDWSAARLWAVGRLAPATGPTEVLALAFDGGSGAELWSDRWVGPAGLAAGGTAVARDASAGAVVAGGWDLGGPSAFDFALRALDEGSGAELWAARSDGPPVSADDRIVGAALAPDGALLAALSVSEGPNAQVAALTAWDAQGNELWSAAWDAPTEQHAAADAVAYDPKGARVFAVVGVQAGARTLVAFDPVDGAELWRADDVGFAPASALAASPDGSAVYATGPTDEVSPADRDFLTVAWDAATGAERWRATLDGLGGDGDVPRGLAVSPDGARVFVAGESSSGTWFDGSFFWPILSFGAVAYDAATGTQQWADFHKPAGSAVYDGDGARALALTPDGALLAVVGTSGDPLAPHTVAYDPADGTVRWTSTHAGATHSTPVAVGASPDGATLAWTARTLEAGSFQDDDWTTVALDAATGAELWTAVRDSGFDDEPAALAFDACGSRVHVTGRVGGGAADVETVAWSAASGARLWTAAYDGPAADQDAVAALALDPGAGRLYVVGETEAGVTARDLAALAYDLPVLAGDVAAVSVAAGGVQVLDACAGPPWAGAAYYVLGSYSGTSPGFVLNGVPVPLNRDRYYNLTLRKPAASPLVGSQAALDAGGHAEALYVAAALPALAGYTLHHAVLVLDPGTGAVALASAPVRLDVLP